MRNQPDSVLDWMRNGRWTRGPGGPKPRWPDWADWFRSPADFPNLTEGLLEVGLARNEVADIMGGNWLRLFREGFGR